MSDHEKTYADFWKGIVENPDGTLNRDQLMLELHDYHTLIKEIPKVYDDITGGRISKPNTAAHHVIAEVNERTEEACEAARREVREELAAEQDALYRERAHLIAALAASQPGAVITVAEPSAPDWFLIYIHLDDAGQVSWHLSPRDLDLFPHVERVNPDDPRAQWDRHTTPEKLARLAEYTALEAERMRIPDELSGCSVVEIDGEEMRIQGGAQMTDAGRAAMGQVVGAAKRRMAADKAAELAQVRAQALREFADLIDKGPAIPLRPSIFSTLARERADDIARGED